MGAKDSMLNLETTQCYMDNAECMKMERMIAQSIVASGERNYKAQYVCDATAADAHAAKKRSG